MMLPKLLNKSAGLLSGEFGGSIATEEPLDGADIAEVTEVAARGAFMEDLDALSRHSRAFSCHNPC